ncbi:MAG: hypothetical protein KGJ32_01715 [Xanthomonadaceae bacterium]|nr:hypothetical protein [Xanthomonadaceae bacterium]
MLEVRRRNNAFLVYDTDAGEPVVLFRTREEADELIEALQTQEQHARLRRWSIDAVPSVH